MAEKKYVVFRLGNEEYGIDIMKVKEVTESKATIKIPNCPSFVEGIINLRGDITPIINLGKKFNLNYQNDEKSTRIIVLNLETKLVGFMVDDASQVITVDDAHIAASPEIVSGVDKEYIEGIAKIDEKMVIILDLLKVLNDEEKEELLEMN